MNWPWHTRVLLALASGLALALSFPNFNLSLLAWISIGLLVLASYRARPAVAPLYGFLHALVFYPICLTWIDVVVRQYGEVPSLIAAGLLALIAIAGGIILALFSLGSCAGVAQERTSWPASLAPCLWVTLEFARAHLPIIGFPWNLAGYAASGSLGLLQFATRNRNLWPELPRRGLWRAACVRNHFGAAARVEDSDFRDRRADFRGRWRKPPCPFSEPALRRPLGPDEFSAIVRVSPGLDAHACARSGPIGAHQRGRGDEGAGTDRVA